MSSYDQWLTTDTAADAAEQYHEYVSDQWEEYAQAKGLPYEIIEEGHAEHAIFAAWLNLFQVVQTYEGRLLAEEEWAAAEHSEAEWDRLAAEARAEYEGGY